MKKLVLFLLLTSGVLTTVAQTKTTTAETQTTTSLTIYQEFQPATIHLVDGKQLRVGLANIFLKNSSLLYKSGQETKEANMKTLVKVEFKDRTYFRIDSVLAYQVDTAGIPQEINSFIVPSALILLPGKVCLPTTVL